ncbi:Low molecular weight phosphotyrosine protein phosphatase [Microbotryomycetes sp. JL221]|nr:Low molecular weight phosphotyrosine protein phosphatase [Microbotryomycetes sp. JL221]
MTVNVLAVCLGNICRSPMAEAVVQHLANERGMDVKVDSAGTAGYHIGEECDERTTATCKKHGVPISGEARQLERSDFDKFDYIVGMDKMNMENIRRIQPKGSKAKVAMFGDYGDGKQVQDPYYGPKNGFETCYEQCVQYGNGLLDEIAKIQ